MEYKYDEKTGVLTMSVQVKGNEGVLSEAGRSFILGKNAEKFEDLSEIHDDLAGVSFMGMVIRKRKFNKKG